MATPCGLLWTWLYPALYHTLWLCTCPYLWAVYPPLGGYAHAKWARPPMWERPRECILPSLLTMGKPREDHGP